jgi:hypothetical protein
MWGGLHGWAVQPPPNPAGTVKRVRGSPATHAACVTGFARIQFRYAAQTMSVLRLMRAMGRPRGLPRPGLAELLDSGEPRRALLAPPLEELLDQLLARGMDRDRGGVLDDRPPILRQDDPAESRYQVLPNIRTGSA